MYPKKLCLITQTLSGGGLERVVSELANSWCKRNDIKVFLLVLTNEEQCYEIDPRVTLIFPSNSERYSPFRKINYRLWLLYFIRSNCLHIKPTAVISFGIGVNLFVLVSLFKTNIKIYISDRCSPYTKFSFLQTKLRIMLYRFATGIVAQTQLAKAMLADSTKNKNIKVIQNPLREIQRYPQNKEVNRKKIILNIGRNVVEKNQFELIDIFSKCDYENWELKLVGVGPLRTQLIEQVSALKLEAHVSFYDFDKSIDKFYSEATIFAFTSIMEGFPNALNEAMAHGIACIAYDCYTGPSEIIENNFNGYLVELQNKEMYIEQLSELMSSTDLRKYFSDNALKDRETYPLENNADLYLAFMA